MKREKNIVKARGFSLIELLTVIAIMSIMMGLLVSTGFGTRPAGSRQGAISQLMGSLEEARMTAIEKNVAVYFGIADTSYPDAEKQLRGYILFRAQTSEEKATSHTEDLVPLSRWDTLPKGFYFDADKFDAVSEAQAGVGLPGNPATVRAIEFGSLGQVKSMPAEAVPQLSVVEAIYNDGSKTLLRKNGGASDFAIKIYRVTGRLQIAKNDAVTP
jgi:prepilin-type N-terminal cleavage/methylation domain-containing protein